MNQILENALIPSLSTEYFIGNCTDGLTDFFMKGLAKKCTGGLTTLTDTLPNPVQIWVSTTLPNPEKTRPFASANRQNRTGGLTDFSIKSLVKKCTGGLTSLTNTLPNPAQIRVLTTLPNPEKTRPPLNRNNQNSQGGDIPIEPTNRKTKSP